MSNLKTRIYKIPSVDEATETLIEDAAQVIRAGGLVVFPTETVYGLGGDATNRSAAKKIYEAKGRPSDNPLIIHVASPAMAEQYAYTNEIYYRLAEKFMPGPLTVILKSKETIPKDTRGGLDTVAVRCPSNPVARELIRRAGVPIAAPSANLSGSPSPTNAEHVKDDMDGRVDVIIDGGDSDFGLESTIVKINDDASLTLLRPGKITLSDLKALSLDVSVANAVTEELHPGDVAISPGMKYRHYAPKAPLVLLDGSAEKCASYIASVGCDNLAVLCYSGDVKLFSDKLPTVVLYDFGAHDDPEKQAHLLFSLLREADKKQFAAIYAPLPETDGIGLALYNRMIRAAAHKIVKL